MRKPASTQPKPDARGKRLAEVRPSLKRSADERKRLHGELARAAGLTDRIAEATAVYERELASGGLRRPAAPRGNRATRKR